MGNNVNLAPWTETRPADQTWIPEPGVTFTRSVPLLLQWIGCMWLDNGDESCRCGQQAAWTMGTDLSLARLYCEEHGRLLSQRRRLHLEQHRQRRMRRLGIQG